ncbi:hypothetical protein FQR65_LT18636 [Abscondita terminalis]|nr:hypothetical protein FQR65_LT18636 [Abscondita terminalis]
MFLKDPQILILDEATSALDNIVEKEIQANLEALMKNRTTISIAHRLSTIKNADQIVVLAKDAGIAQIGTFEELKKVDGHFKNLYNAGLAGCEAAYQLAKKNIEVNLYEVKRLKRNPVQEIDEFAELVCSNTLRSTDLLNAVGSLKSEMEKFDSLILKAAKFAQIPAGGSLAVDRNKFSDYITDFLENHKLVNVIDKEITKIDPSDFTIICSGPLTTELLQKEISSLIGKDYFYFFDAVAPIIKKESINMSKVYKKNRYDKGETQDYLNCPMNEEEYNIFYKELINANTIELHLENEKNLKFFEGCMPVEAMAKRGIQTLTFGPLKPAGLTKPNGERPFAVVQLRQDNAKNDLYNMVGFQTNLT